MPYIIKFAMLVLPNMVMCRVIGASLAALLSTLSASFAQETQKYLSCPLTYILSLSNGPYKSLITHGFSTSLLILMVLAPLQRGKSCEIFRQRGIVARLEHTDQSGQCAPMIEFRSCAIRRIPMRAEIFANVSIPSPL